MQLVILWNIKVDMCIVVISKTSISAQGRVVLVHISCTKHLYLLFSLVQIRVILSYPELISSRIYITENTFSILVHLTFRHVVTTHERTIVSCICIIVCTMTK